MSRMLSAAGGAGIVLALTFIFVPDLLEIVDRSAGWFSGGEVFHDRIVELSPMLPTADAKGFERLILKFSYLALLLPFAWIVVLVRRPLSLDRWLLVFWCLVFAIATMTQIRFTNSLCACFALVWGVAVGDLVGLAREHIRVRRVVAWGSAAFAGVAIVALLSGIAGNYRQIFDHGFDQVRPRRGSVRNFLAREAAIHIARTAPPVVDANGGLRYSVLSAWGLGHLIRYHSKKPMVQDNFGPYAAPENVALATRYFEAEDEPVAIALLDRMGARYVVVDRLGAGRSEPYESASMTKRFVEQRGGLMETLIEEGSRKELSPALTQHRLVYETNPRLPRMQVWERVPGAHLFGRTRPGGVVRVNLDLKSKRAEFTYLNFTIADDSGRYAIRLPYPSTDFAGEFKAQGEWTIRTSRSSVELSISEQAVTTGARVEGPTFD